MHDAHAIMKRPAPVALTEPINRLNAKKHIGLVNNGRITTDAE